MDGSSNAGSGSFPKTLTAIAGLITAVAALIGALAAIGVFAQESAGGQPPTTQEASPSTTPTIQPPATPPTTPPPAGPERVDITLNYLGDFDNCSLPLTVTIGELTVNPVGSSYTVSNVEVGLHDYAVAGTIQCPTLGSCQATGSGVIDIAAGRDYFVVWQNVALGQCNVTLQA